MFFYSPLEQFEIYRTILTDLDSVGGFFFHKPINASEKFYKFFDTLTVYEQLCCIVNEKELEDNYGKMYFRQLSEEISRTGKMTLLEMIVFNYSIGILDDKEFYDELDIVLENLSQKELDKVIKISNSVKTENGLNNFVKKNDFFLVNNLTEAELLDIMVFVNDFPFPLEVKDLLQIWLDVEAGVSMTKFELFSLIGVQEIDLKLEKSFVENLTKAEILAIMELVKGTKLRDIESFLDSIYCQLLTNEEFLSLMEDVKDFKSYEALYFQILTKAEILDLMAAVENVDDKLMGMLNMFIEIMNLVLVGDVNLIREILGLDFLIETNDNEFIIGNENFSYFTKLCNVYLYGENVALIDIVLEELSEKQCVLLKDKSLELVCTNRSFFIDIYNNLSIDSLLGLSGALPQKFFYYFVANLVDSLSEAKMLGYVNANTDSEFEKEIVDLIVCSGECVVILSELIENFDSSFFPILTEAGVLDLMKGVEDLLEIVEKNYNLLYFPTLTEAEVVELLEIVEVVKVSNVESNSFFERKCQKEAMLLTELLICLEINDSEKIQLFNKWWLLEQKKMLVENCISCQEAEASLQLYRAEKNQVKRPLVLQLIKCLYYFSINFYFDCKIELQSIFYFFYNLCPSPAMVPYLLTIIFFTSSFLLFIIFCIFIIFFLQFFLIQRTGQLLFLYYYYFIKNVISDLISSKIGQQYYFHLISWLFILLTFLNIFGLIPNTFVLTSQFSFTFYHSFLYFVTLNFTGIVLHGTSIFNLFFPKGAPIFIAPLLVIIEFISYFARVFSLAIRLFANITAGHILLKILSGFTFTMITLIFAFFLSTFIIAVLWVLEFFIGILQAYVFTILVCIYLSDVIVLH
jgi:F-type H+-transporting ATPase subunit a